VTQPRESDVDEDEAQPGEAGAEPFRLISVLFASQPLPSRVAWRLARAAFDLYASDGATQRLKGGLCEGEVRNLRQELLLGTIPGHAFEAEVDTETGSTRVRYLLTQQGIEAFAASRPRPQLN